MGDLGWISGLLLGAFLVTSWGTGIRRARGTGRTRVVRLDDPDPPTEAAGLELSTAYDGSATVIALVGAMDRPESLELASHLAGLVSSGSERIVVDAEKAHPASRVVDALALAAPILERHGPLLALVPPRGEMLSVSVKLTANGFAGSIGVYDSVVEATKALGRAHARP